MMKRRQFVGLLAAAPLAQLQSKSVRRKVVPLEAIQKFNLQPTHVPFGPFVLGEDGKTYDFDDVIAVLFEITREHWSKK
jgi:hypothetical protein